MACRGLRLIESDNSNIYHRVAAEIVETFSILNTAETAAKVGITIGNPSDWSILPTGSDERICNYFEGFFISSV